jgi:hypothetical protein
MVNNSGTSIFDFTVESKIPFQFLRAGQGQHVLHVHEASNSMLEQEGSPLMEWKLRDQSAEVTARLYRSQEIYYFWASDAGWYRVDPSSLTITIPTEGDVVRREIRLWGIPTLLCFLQFGDIPLHASAVEVAGGAVLFAAPGRFGKTTLALAFHRRGYRVLSEDMSCCRLAPIPSLLAGPAALRLRPDVFDGHEPAGMTLVLNRPDRIFFALNADRSGNCHPVPIKAIIFLRESDEDIRLEQVEKARALPDLWSLNFRIGVELAQSFSALSQLAHAASVWNLYRPLRMDVMDDVVSRIVEACASTP